MQEVVSPSHSTAYPSIEISEDTLDVSIHCSSNYNKNQFVRFYSNINYVLAMTVLYVIILTNFLVIFGHIGFTLSSF